MQYVMAKGMVTKFIYYNIVRAENNLMYYLSRSSEYFMLKFELEGQ